VSPVPLSIGNRALCSSRVGGARNVTRLNRKPPVTQADARVAPTASGRGRAQRSLDLIAAMYAAAEAAQPITGRGIGYKLFTQGLIASMSRNEMQKVYRLLKEAREEGIIPWLMPQERQ
jgi:hypothetical protein